MSKRRAARTLLPWQFVHEDGEDNEIQCRQRITGRDGFGPQRRGSGGSIYDRIQGGSILLPNKLSGRSVGRKCMGSGCGGRLGSGTFATPDSYLPAWDL